MSATQTAAPGGPSANDLPPELARFWTAFATSQIRKGRRDIGAMVQAALEYLFERGTHRLKPMMRSQEDFEAFRNALRDEFARIDKALDNHSDDASNQTLVEPYAPKQFRISRREDDSKPATDAVQTTYWPRNLSQRDEVERYRAALDKQFAATLQAIEENTKRLMEARQQLQAQLVPYSPAFYNVATRLLAEYDTTMRPRNAGLAKPGDEGALVPTGAQDPKGVMERLGADLAHRLKPGSAGAPAAPPPPTDQERFERWLSALNSDAQVTGLAPVAEPRTAFQRFMAWLGALFGQG